MKEWDIRNGMLLKRLFNHENLDPGRIFGKRHPNNNSEHLEHFCLVKLFLSYTEMYFYIICVFMSFV